MKKTLILYFGMIFTICLLALLMNSPLQIFPFLEFNKGLHVALETTISIFMFLISLSAYKLFAKTEDNRFLIVAGGFLLSFMLNIIHIFTVPVFPFDTLSFINIQKNPTLVYLCMSWLVQPLAIYYSLIYRPNLACKGNHRIKTYNIYAYIMILLIAVPLIIYYFLPNHLTNFYVIAHSLEYVNYAIYLILAVIIMNLNLSSKGFFFDKFMLGLLIIGLSGIFYINPMLLPEREILAHFFQLLGLVLILLGLPQIQTISASIRIKDELVTYLSLVLIFFYVAIVAVISGIFNIIFPQVSGYIFIEMLLLFQLIVYAFSTVSWNKFAGVYISAERDRALIRILESMRRGANPIIIKNTVVEEIRKDLGADKCFIALIDEQNQSFYLDRYEESLPSKTLANFDDLDEDENRFKKFVDVFKNIEINFYKLEDYISERILKGTSQENILNELNLKSLYTIPINFNKKTLGYLILYFTTKYKELNMDDITYLNKMATQIGISIGNNKIN